MRSRERANLESKAMTRYRVTLENYEGDCKRVTVKSTDPYDAMALAQECYRGWYPVDVELA